MQAICVNRNRYFITLFFVSLLWANLLSLSEYKLAFANEPDDTGELQNSFLSKMQVGGYLKNETAYRFDEPRTITKLRNIFELNAQFPVGNSAKVTASGWAYYDLAYDLFDYETIAARFVRDESQPLVFVENLQQEKEMQIKKRCMNSLLKI